MHKNIVKIVLPGLALGLLLGGCKPKPEATGPEFTVLPGTEATVLPPENESAEELDVPKDDGTAFPMLVNGENGLPEDYAPELVTEGAKIAVEIADDFADMRLAAAEEGIVLMVASAFRTYAEQKVLYDELGAALAQRPGYSEHQTGLAVDFSYGGLSSAERDVMWNWLRDNAHSYGFILRYPAGKEGITGIDYEPWHYRHVGREHAEIIYEQDLVLEEYLAIYTT